MSIPSESIEMHQRQLLTAIEEFFQQRGSAMPPAIRDAFLAVPRHLFVPRYKTSPDASWQDVNAANLGQHLPLLYRDDGLGIFDDGTKVSTISRPALVLFMLHLLNLERGQRILEVGAGSGWNAALMGALVGAQGHVESVEIISELVAPARRALTSLGLTQVDVHHSDGGERAGTTAFDRIVFTTGAYDIPAWMHQRLSDGGVLLMVLKCPGGGDVLIPFRREGGSLVSMDAYRCEFIPMLGLGGRDEHEPVRLEEFLARRGLADGLRLERPFPCGGRHAHDFTERTFPLRSFLAATEPSYTPLVDSNGRAFAVTSSSGDWAVIIRHGRACCYGSEAGWEHVAGLLKRWVELGMPTMLSMNVRAYPSGQAVNHTANGCWLMRRRETDFVWST